MDFADEEGWDKDCQGFEDWEKAINEFKPDIVILDWMEDADNPKRGKSILDTVWRNQFRPIIIFSAVASTIILNAEMRENPLITVISKGDEEIVVDKLKEWSKYVPAIRDLKENMNNALIDALKAINMFKSMSYPGDSVVKYMITKRAGNYFNRNFDIENPPAWIQYIYPPMDEDFLVCDVIRTVSAESDLTKPGAPDEYRVILSPSCDMANRTELHILIAKCVSKEKFSDIRLGDSETFDSRKGKEKVDRVSKLLNQGYSGAKVSIPEIPGVLPYLTVDLKNLEQIALQDIAVSYNGIQEQHKYFRVASIDSPFREQIVWAHMLNSCRPGVPNRDTKTWAEGVLNIERR